MTIPSKIIPFQRKVYPALVPAAQGTDYPRFEAERARNGLPPRILPGSEEKHEQRPLD
jgi:hypothetical protein